MHDTDTIVAIATPPGRGGVGIVRVSGPAALAIGTAITGVQAPAPRYARYSHFHDPDGELIDEGLLLYFPGPHSFTGDDVVEFQGHGGPVPLDLLVRACIRHGARQARGGEFSMRAFLNDRMDLTRAEAIADLIDAGSEASARAALQSLQGAFATEIDRLVENLVALRVHVEAAIDFPDEEIDFLSEHGIAGRLDQVLDDCIRVLATARQGRLLREGMTLVIAGRPNAGKSSLLNALSGQESAIVTEVAGTTRDLLREAIQLDGLPLNIVDTAGLRESPDRVEREGIRRAWAEIEAADHVLVVADSTETGATPQSLDELLPDAQRRISALSVPVTLVLNKADLSGLPPGSRDNLPWPARVISATTGEGLDGLRQHLKTLAGYRGPGEHRFSARRRHVTALEQAQQALEQGRAALGEHNAGELLAEDLRAAQRALEEITGAFTADDLLGHIFSSFCIGK